MDSPEIPHAVACALFGDSQLPNTKCDCYAIEVGELRASLQVVICQMCRDILSEMEPKYALDRVLEELNAKECCTHEARIAELSASLQEKELQLEHFKIRELQLIKNDLKQGKELAELEAEVSRLRQLGVKS